MSVKFQWPWQYSFPPFFTLQPNADTRRKQVDAWCQLILSYHQARKEYHLDIQEAHNSELFNNKSINRQLSHDVILTILGELQKRGNLEWTDKTMRRCKIIWRTTEEWGDLIYKWAKSTGHLNTVCTLFELMEGDDTESEPFHGLDKDIMIQAIKTLEKNNKAEIIMFDSNEGVKFFS